MLSPAGATNPADGKPGGIVPCVPRAASSSNSTQQRRNQVFSALTQYDEQDQEPKQ